MKNGSRMAGQGFVEEIKIGDVGPPAAGLKKVDNRNLFTLLLMSTNSPKNKYLIKWKYVWRSTFKIQKTN